MINRVPALDRPEAHASGASSQSPRARFLEHARCPRPFSMQRVERSSRPRARDDADHHERGRKVCPDSHRLCLPHRCPQASMPVWQPSAAQCAHAGAEPRGGASAPRPGHRHRRSHAGGPPTAAPAIAPASALPISRRGTDDRHRRAARVYPAGSEDVVSVGVARKAFVSSAPLHALLWGVEPPREDSQHCAS
jgi:hypothetical protein